jgi:hypothetical protein
VERLVGFTVSSLLVVNSLALLGALDKITLLEVELASHEQLIAACEESLPRSKTCKLIAVEESE